jgi:NADPH:quinone reductase-like Zn-dependent oxidoreductase
VIALAKHAGLRTLNVVRRASAVQPLLDGGADIVLVSGEGLAEQAADAIGDAPIELLIDAVGGEPATQLAPLLKTGGAIVSYSALDRKPISVPPLDLIYRGLSLHGYWLKLWLENTPRTTVTETYRELAALVADGTLAAPVDATYTLEDHRAAFGHASQNGDARNGKVLFSFEGSTP